MEVEYLLGGSTKRTQIHSKKNPDLLKVMIFNSFGSIRKDINRKVREEGDAKVFISA